MNDHAVEATIKRKGKVINRDHTVISEDGKTMTSTPNVIGEDGGKFHKVEIYEKQ